MSYNDKKIWILIRYYNQKERNNDNTQHLLREVTLPSIFTFTELKAAMYYWANIEENDSYVIKLRQNDYTLVPLSALFEGSLKEKPFIMDVVGVHQICAVKIRSISEDYTNTLKSKLEDIEKRIMKIETSIPGLSNTQVTAMKDVTNQLSNCITFLNRRLDELTPADWKSHV